MSYKIEVKPSTLFVTTMLRNNIKAYRKGCKKAEKFLFEDGILRDFLTNFGFKNVRIDLLRQKIQDGKRMNNLC